MSPFLKRQVGIGIRKRMWILGTTIQCELRCSQQLSPLEVWIEMKVVQTSLIDLVVAIGHMQGWEYDFRALV